MPTLTSAERIGSVIAGRYEIRRLIGEGGFSAVFEAVHVVTGGRVAVKLLHPHLVATEQIRTRFLMEAQAMARVNHDGIVKVLDAVVDDDSTVFMVLEYLSGEPLETTLSRVRLTWDETVNVGLDVLAALAEAHRHKIIHRDIKPGNIFIVHKSDGSSHAKLLDFGIAHIARPDGKPVTQQGMILGTPEYMSPEQGRAGVVGPESDIWSVGIVLFECLTGYTPFVAESTTEVLLKVATTNAPSLRALSPDVPAPIAAVIDRSLERELSQRYRTAEQMRDALLEARVMIDSERNATQSWEPPSPSPVPKRPPAPTLGEQDVSAAGALRQPSELPSIAAPVRATQNSSVFRAPSGANPTPSNATSVRARMQPDFGARAPATPARISGSQWSAENSGERLSTPDEELFGADAGQPLPALSDDFGAPEESPSFRKSSEAFAPRLSQAGQPAGPQHDARSPRRGDTEGLRTTRTTFKAPPVERRAPPTVAIVGAIAVVVVGVVAWFGLRSPDVAPVPPTDPNTRPEVGNTPEPPVEPHPTVPVPNAGPELVSRYAIAPPGGGSASDQIAEFARHLAVSPVGNTTQRVLATCIPAAEGAGVYLYQLTAGTPLASSRGQVACSGFDLGIIRDASGDGTDDVVAIAPGGGEVVVLDSRSMMASQHIPIVGARGLATGLQFEGESAVLVYTEQAGLTGPTSVQALMLNSRRVRWQVQGSGTLGRVGQPVELGLSVGPDASGDGVPDVAMGIGPVAGTPPQALPERTRCVQLFSGADGTAVWPQPFCQLRGTGSQSVSLGPDVDGDGRGDVAIGTDHPAGTDPPVVIVSGRDAHLLRAITPPAGESGVGFGWPVALGGDIHGDGTPDLAVGSIGPATYFTLFDGTTGQSFASQRLGGVGAGSLRLAPFPGGISSAPWSVLVGNPGEGLRAYNSVELEP